LKHLKEKQKGTSCSDMEFFEKYPFYNVRVLEGLHSLLQLNRTDNKKTMRTPKEMVALKRTDLDAYEAFCVLLLKHAIGKVSWRASCRSERISEIFTLSDEAFAFLVLDNNINSWRKYFLSDVDMDTQSASYGQGGKGKKSEMAVETKYTKKGGGNKDKAYGCWTNEGIRTYNALLQEVKNLREIPDSKSTEDILMDRWRQDEREYFEKKGKTPPRYDMIIEDTEEDLGPVRRIIPCTGIPI
jgi:hypothetical protein